MLFSRLARWLVPDRALHWERLTDTPLVMLAADLGMHRSMTLEEAVAALTRMS